jgi:hypothetical protein
MNRPYVSDTGAEIDQRKLKSFGVFRNAKNEMHHLCSLRYGFQRRPVRLALPSRMPWALACISTGESSW